MSENKVFSHLLDIEKQAGELLEGAEIEAAKRLEAAEKAGREAYEKAYAEKAALLEENYKKEEAAMELAYNQKLEAYRSDLDSRPLQQSEFNTLLDSMLGL
jgi:hypothetical protein